MGEQLLIVTADDFGLTEGVSRGIIDGHVNGVITATSILAIGPAFDSSVSLLKTHPSLDAGVHLAVVGEDPPLLPASNIPTLSPRGKLPGSWRSIVPRMTLGLIDPDDVRREFEAQVHRVATTGIRITHLNAHQHLHLLPSVGNIVVNLAKDLQVPVRVPRSLAQGVLGSGIRLLARRLESLAGGLPHPQEFAGLDEAGNMTSERFDAALARFAAGDAAVAEIVVHPGAAGDPARARYRWGYSWEEELTGLTRPGLAASIESMGFTLGGYSKLLPAAA